MTRLAYSIPEAAEVLGISDSHLREQVRAGSVPTLRIGRRTLIPAAGLAAWVEDHTTPAA